MTFTNAEKLTSLRALEAADRLGLFRHPRIKYAASKNCKLLGRELETFREEQQAHQDEHARHDEEHGTPLLRAPGGAVVRRVPGGGLRTVATDGKEEQPYGPEQYVSEEQARRVLSQLDLCFKSDEDRAAYEEANAELLAIEEEVEVHQVDGSLLDDRDNFDPEVLKTFYLGSILWMFEREEE